MKIEGGKEISIDIRELLDKHPWKTTLSKLRKYASRQIYFKCWRGSKGGIPPGGIMAEDYVMIAIIKVYKGIRCWNPSKDPRLYYYLKDTIHSEIGHHSRSQDNVRLYRDNDSKSENYKNCCSVDNYPSCELRHDKKLIIEEFIERFKKVISKDKELVEIITAVPS